MIAKELRKAGLDVRIQGETADLPRQLSDPDWADFVARQGWVAVTRDKRMRYRAAEKRAIASSGLALFVLVSRYDIKRSDIISQIEAAAPRMARFMRQHSPPFIAGIDRSGKIRLHEKL